MATQVRNRLHGLYGIAGPTGPGDASERRRQTIELAGALITGGAPILQLRDKVSTGRELLETAIIVREMTSAAGVLFIVNDRLDVALCSHADGVHVGQVDLPVEDVRRVAALAGRPDMIVGLSTHDLGQVAKAVALDADYIGYGPVFATGTKANALAPRGVDALARAVLGAETLPVVAIGGIGLATAAQIRASGAAMAAVIGDISNAPDRAGRARELHTILKG